MQLLYVESHGEIFEQYIVSSSKLDVLIQGQALHGVDLVIREVPEYLVVFLTMDWVEGAWFKATHSVSQPLPVEKTTNPQPKEYANERNPSY